VILIFLGCLSSMVLHDDLQHNSLQLIDLNRLESAFRIATIDFDFILLKLDKYFYADL